MRLGISRTKVGDGTRMLGTELGFTCTFSGREWKMGDAIAVPNDTRQALHTSCSLIMFYLESNTRFAYELNVGLRSMHAAMCVCAREG